MRKRTSAATAMVLATIALFSCDRSPTMPRLNQLMLDVVSGDGQTGVVGTQLAPLIVKVTSNGNPVAEQVLNFKVISGGGSVYGGTELTDDHGIAQELWTLGTNASQPQKVEVRAVESSTGAEKVFGTFRATALPDKADSLFAATGNNQTAVAGSTVAISPAVEVTDRYGNPIAGVNVTFAVGLASGSATGLSQTTSANGTATVGLWTLSGTAGSNTLLATTPSMILAPTGSVTFTAVGISGNAAQLVVLSGDNQSQSVCTGAPLQNKPTVRVIDPNGNGVSNVAVTFTITGGGGSIDGVGSVTTLTSAGTMSQLAGSAAVNWRLGDVSGPNALQATAEGLSGSPLVFNAAGSGNCWTTKASMPTARHSVAIAALGGVLYAVGGESANDCTFLSTLEAYDPVANTWSTKPSMPTRRRYPGAAAINGLLYVVGGSVGCGATTGAVEAYDPAAKTWTTKAPMPTAREGLGVAVVNGVLYAVGGLDAGGTRVPTVEAYDPSTDTWTTKAPMLAGQYGMAIGVVNGVIYVAGGQFAPTLVEAYDPATNAWTSKAPLPTGRTYLAGGVVNDVFYAVGGIDGGLHSTVEAYDPVSDTWTNAAPMPTARYALGVGVLNGVLYAVGGYNTGYLATVEAYQP